MATFDVHSDVHEISALQGPDGLASVGLWGRCGSWTASNGRTGFVPDQVAQTFGANQDDVIQKLVDAGLWERAEGGYRMLRGPSEDPDSPLPLWRYGDGDFDGWMVVADDTPDT